MITKERLEELIKERASVYIPDKHWGVGTIKLQKKNYIREGRLNGSGIIYENISGTNIGYSMSLKDIFENKEDAEFAIKYQNITRTETLNLPTFEEFNKLEKYVFIGKNQVSYILYKKNNFICLGVDADILSYDEAKWILNKTNYLRACELCRKLFLGEE